MNIFLRSCTEIFRSRPAYVFLLGNLFICSFALDWKKVFDYVEKINEPNCKTKIIFSSPGSISFSGNCYGTRQTTSDEILIGFFNFISFPSLIGTEIFIEDLKKNQPDWCIETFEVLELFVFTVFNSLYFFLFGIFIEQLYEKHYTKPMTKEKYLNL